MLTQIHGLLQAIALAFHVSAFVMIFIAIGPLVIDVRTRSWSTVQT